MSRERPRPAQRPRAWAARAPRPRPPRRLSWERTVLATQKPRKPTEENAPTLPAAPPLRTAPGADGARPPPRPPRTEKPPAAKMLPPHPNHSLPIKTLILFLILRWEGWDGAGGRGDLRPSPRPGCVEVVQSHCRALYVLDYCYILYIFLFFFLFIFAVYLEIPTHCDVFKINQMRKKKKKKTRY